MLEKISRDLVVVNKDNLDKGNNFEIIGRDDFVKQIKIGMGKAKKPNIILVGDAGVGKSALIEALSIYIINNKYDVKIWEFNSSNLNHLMNPDVIAELSQSGNYVFFDEIHIICNTTPKFSDYIKPYLANGTIRMIGCTTTSEFSIIEKDQAFLRRFNIAYINEPSVDDTIKIGNNAIEFYKSKHEIDYEEGSVELIVKLTNRYIRDRKFPDKALDILDEVGSRNRTEIHDSIMLLDKLTMDLTNDVITEEYFKIKSTEILDTQMSLSTVTHNDIKNYLANKLNIPSINSDDKEMYMNLSENLSKDVIGQDDAINSISRILKRNIVGLGDSNRPVGVFMFIGTTGGGKTHITKMLAKQIFGDEKNMLKIDMSEYGEKHNVARLIGSPAGYVGYGESNKLREHIKQNPYTVILLDEIEKAHSDVLTIFLQIFEDGTLTMGTGEVLDFRNCIFVMTSNVGSKSIKNRKGVGFVETTEESKLEKKKLNNIKSDLDKHFAPEFLNRIDDIITFNNLNKDDILKIVDIEMSKLSEKLKTKNINLNYSLAVKEKLMEIGFDKDKGARPLKRAITNNIENEIADILISNNNINYINIDVVEDEFTFTYSNDIESLVLKGIEFSMS